MTTPDPRTVLTPQLVARWIATIGSLIRDQDKPELIDIHVGAWDTLTDGQRIRLSEIALDLLVLIDDAGFLAKVNRAILPRVSRDHRGRRLGSPRSAATAAGSAPSCTCGRPTTLGTVHRIAAPCYIPGRESTNLREAMGSVVEPLGPAEG